MNANEMERFLRQNNLYCDCYDKSERLISIEIEGDWKHEHLRLKWILEEKGYECIKVYEEPSDDDCYFARYCVYKRV